MTKSLLQLTEWKIVNIHPFCWLRNECVFCTCKQHSDHIPDLQGVHFPSYLLPNFFILLFRMVFPPMSCFRLLFLWKAITVSTGKVLSKALLVSKMDQWFRIICFLLESVQLYVTLSGITWAFCVVLVLANLSCPKV